MIGNPSLIFSVYDNCIVSSTCKLERILKQLAGKIEEFKQEIKYEESGLGDFNVNRKSVLNNLKFICHTVFHPLGIIRRFNA